MLKSEFTERVCSWAKARYGLELGPALLEDLMKDDFIDTGERQPNNGIYPVYSFGSRSYRRAIQIARIRKDGFIGRDEIRLQLFVRRYARVGEAREALLREYVKSGKHILAQLRSRYVYNDRPIPNNQKGRLGRAFGGADTRFVSAGFTLGADHKIALIRAATQEPISLSMKDLAGRFRELINSRQLDFATLANLFAPLISGTLMFDPDATDNSEAIDYVERMIIGSNDAEFETARALFGLFNSERFPLARHCAAVMGGDTEAVEVAYDALGTAAKREGFWTAAVLVACLLASRALGISNSAVEIAALINSLKHPDRLPLNLAQRTLPT